MYWSQMCLSISHLYAFYILLHKCIFYLFYCYQPLRLQSPSNAYLPYFHHTPHIPDSPNTSSFLAYFPPPCMKLPHLPLKYCHTFPIRSKGILSSIGVQVLITHSIINYKDSEQEKLCLAKKNHIIFTQVVFVHQLLLKYRQTICRRPVFDPWVGKILWRKECLQVFLPGEFHGQRSLASQRPQGLKELDTAKKLALSLSDHLDRQHLSLPWACALQECRSKQGRISFDKFQRIQSLFLSLTKLSSS